MAGRCSLCAVKRADRQTDRVVNNIKHEVPFEEPGRCLEIGNKPQLASITRAPLKDPLRCCYDFIGEEEGGSLS